MCWYDRQYLIVATLAGDLIVISQFDTYQVIEDVAPSRITKVAEFSGGLAVGCEKGEILLFQFDKTVKSFGLFKVWKCKELDGTKIISIVFHHASKTEIHMAVSNEHKSVVHLDIFEAFFSDAAQL